MERDPVAPAQAQRRQAVLVLQSSERALDGTAPTIEVTPPLQVARDERVAPVSLDPDRGGLALSGRAAPLRWLLRVARQRTRWTGRSGGSAISRSRRSRFDTAARASPRTRGIRLSPSTPKRLASPTTRSATTGRSPSDSPKTRVRPCRGPGGAGGCLRQKRTTKNGRASASSKQQSRIASGRTRTIILSMRNCALPFVPLPRPWGKTATQLG